MIERSGHLPDGSSCRAVFSADERHRYLLERRFPGHEPGDPFPLFAMLNPSTATHEVSDPTVTRCAGFARRWGYTAFQVVNLFSLRSTDPRALYEETAPAGDPENAFHIIHAARDAEIVVCAWGVHGALGGRGELILGALCAIDRLAEKLHCLDVTKDAHPKHPLYLPGSLQPKPYRGNLIS